MDRVHPFMWKTNQYFDDVITGQSDFIVTLPIFWTQDRFLNLKYKNVLDFEQSAACLKFYLAPNLSIFTTHNLVYIHKQESLKLESFAEVRKSQTKIWKKRLKFERTERSCFIWSWKVSPQLEKSGWGWQIWMNLERCDWYWKINHNFQVCPRLIQEIELGSVSSWN